VNPITKPFRWGIISTGVIATCFAHDLLVDPNSRKVHDVEYRIVAVGSRSQRLAQAFIDKLKGAAGPSQWGVQHGVLDEAKAYGSYEQVFGDPDVDGIYIGTPHTSHYANTKSALLAHKHVLCEKPFTFDLAELDELIVLAKQQGCFLMEAVWTRFHPLTYAVEELVHSGRLGDVKRLTADLSLDMKIDLRAPDNRLIDPSLAGGALLDLGPYPALWAMLILHRHPKNKGRLPELVNSYQRVYSRTGVDAASHWIVRWDGLAEAFLTVDMTMAGTKESCVVVSCEAADVVIEWPPFKPYTFHIIPHPPLDDDGAVHLPTGGSEVPLVEQKSSHSYPLHPGGGWHYQADEVVRCVRHGRMESDRMPLNESRIVQSWFDQVRRAGHTVMREKNGEARQSDD